MWRVREVAGHAEEGEWSTWWCWWGFLLSLSRARCSVDRGQIPGTASSNILEGLPLGSVDFSKKKQKKSPETDSSSLGLPLLLHTPHTITQVIPQVGTWPTWSPFTFSFPPPSLFLWLPQQIHTILSACSTSLFPHNPPTYNYSYWRTWKK